MPYEYEDEAEIYDAKTNGLTRLDLVWIIACTIIVVLAAEIIFQ